MTVYVPRKGWTPVAATNAVRWDPDGLLGGAIHWFGVPDGPTDHSRCDDILRGVLASHKGGEFNDIAYNHAACRHGYAYELRGYNYQTGANGTTEGNRHFYAIVYLMGVGNPAASFTAEGKAALKYLIKQWQAKGAGTVVRPHRYFTGSSCPGPTILPWVNAGLWKEGGGGGSTPTPPSNVSMIPDWLDEWLYWVFVHGRDPAKRPAVVPDFGTLTQAQRDDAWEVATAVHRVITHAGAPESVLDWVRWRLVDNSDPAKRPQVPEVIPTPWWDDATKIHSIAEAYAAKK
jgi:hypothetical protein